MDRFPRSLLRLLPELRKRNVFRVAVTYGVVGWLLIQMADVVFPALGLPGWTVTLVVVLAFTGFPVALVLAWSFELTPDGVRRDASSSAAESSGDAVAGEPQPSIPALPQQATRLVGRQRELADLRALLADPDCRLVTLTGTGGVGKTRLALETVSVVAEEYPDGIWFVSLVSLTTIEALVPTIAERLRLPISAREDVKRQLLGYLSTRRLLLLLDNFEQLTEGAPLLRELLEAAPGLRLVVTSRERLGLHGERLFPVRGLSTPGAGAGHAGPESSDSVQLFLQGARRVEPGFPADAGELACIGRICTLVEGLPLAIELAAPWVATLTCEEIEREIRKDHDFLSGNERDTPKRHRSLRAVFESSWRLLPEAERRAYRRLSVFQGGFTRESAERVAQASLPTLSALLDRSLLRRSTPGRYEPLEVLRQYAAEKLAEDPPEQEWTTARHTDLFTELLSQVRPRVHEGPGVLAPVRAEIDNVRLAWSRAVSTGDLEAIDRSLDTLFAFYDARGWVQEGEQAFGAAAEGLAAGGTGGDGARMEMVRARLRVRQGVFCHHLGLHLKAKELIESALETVGPEFAPTETAFATDRLGQIAFAMGDYPEAERLHQESVALFRRTADGLGTARALISLGNVMQGTGRAGEARRIYRESLAILRASGDEVTSAFPLVNLGVLAMVEGSFPEAERAFHQSLAIARSTENRRLEANCLHNLGCASFRAKRLEAAEGYLREGIAISEEAGLRRFLVSSLKELAQVLTAREEHAMAAALRLRALEEAARINQIPTVLQILVHIARDLGQAAEGRARAHELVSLVLDHPAADEQARGEAGLLLEELERESTAVELRRAHPSQPSATLAGTVEQILSEPRPLSVVSER